jgi:hypothetical protein
LRARTPTLPVCTTADAKSRYLAVLTTPVNFSPLSVSALFHFPFSIFHFPFSCVHTTYSNQLVIGLHTTNI